MSALLTWNQAAKALGWTGKAAGRRLKRAVLARERQTGKRIATRLGSERRPDYRVTIGAIRRHLPELRPSKVDDLRERFGEYLASIDTRMSDSIAHHVAEYVEPRLDELWQRDEEIAERVNDLGLRVKLIADRMPTNDRDRPLSTTLSTGIESPIARAR